MAMHIMVGNELQDVRVAFVVANAGVEQDELLRPWRAVVDAGGIAELVAPRPGMVETMRHLDRADRFPVDRVTDRVRADDYDAVVLPGGVANADQLRRDDAAVDFLMAVFEAAKPVAATTCSKSSQGRMRPVKAASTRKTNRLPSRSDNRPTHVSVSSVARPPHRYMYFR